MTRPQMRGVFDPNGNSRNEGYDITSSHISQWRILMMETFLLNMKIKLSLSTLRLFKK